MTNRELKVEAASAWARLELRFGSPKPLTPAAFDAIERRFFKTNKDIHQALKRLSKRAQKAV